MSENYIRIKPLGEGATGSVFLVKRKSDNKLFVQKIIKREYTDLARAETQILEKIKNKCTPYLMCIETSFFDKNGANIIAEYIPNSVELFDFITKEGLHNLYVNFVIARNLFIGLLILHGNGVVHKDIKLENILLEQKNLTTHYIDYGFACAKDNIACLNERNGTLAYISPEMLAIGPKTFEMVAESDIWSLALTLYCLYVGEDFYSSVGMDTPQKILSILPRIKQRDIDRLLHEIAVENPTKKFVCELIWPMLQVDWRKRITASECVDRIYKMTSKLLNRPDLSEDAKAREIFNIAMISIGSPKLPNRGEKQIKLKRHKSLLLPKQGLPITRRNTK